VDSGIVDFFLYGMEGGSVDAIVKDVTGLDPGSAEAMEPARDPAIILVARPARIGEREKTALHGLADEHMKVHGLLQFAHVEEVHQLERIEVPKAADGDSERRRIVMMRQQFHRGIEPLNRQRLIDESVGERIDNGNLLRINPRCPHRPREQLAIQPPERRERDAARRMVRLEAMYADTIDLIARSRLKDDQPIAAVPLDRLGIVIRKRPAPTRRRRKDPGDQEIDRFIHESPSLPSPTNNKPQLSSNHRGRIPCTISYIHPKQLSDR